MEIEEIAPKAALVKVENGTVFVDVREQYEVDDVAYDLPGILHIPLGDLPTRMTEIPQGANVIIGCRSGARSLNACKYLVMQGFENVSNLQGGINGWIENDCPTK